MMKLSIINYQLSIIIVLCLLPFPLHAGHHIYSPQVKTLQAVVNHDWLSPTVMRLGSDDILRISFDELSHDYHRYVSRVERCEADWTTSGEVFESDWMEGFNGLPIDDYERSQNTIVPYTHYRLQIPNDQLRLTMSGNYRVHIIDDDTQEEAACVELMVTEQSMALSLEATSNTDIDANGSHQQLSVRLSFGDALVTQPDEQIYTVVTQNNRQDTSRRNVRPTLRNGNGLVWQHARELIFDGGNEYHKFEILDPSHPTMGIDHIIYDGEMYQVYPFASEPRLNYIYDEDADGAFYIRNSDNRENDLTCEYVYVNYELRMPPLLQGTVIIDGQWTTEPADTYLMTYDADSRAYTARILQKQGYYSWQYLWQSALGEKKLKPQISNLKSEGSFHQTENRYQAYVYFKGTGERTWRLTAYRELCFPAR